MTGINIFPQLVHRTSAESFFLQAVKQIVAGHDMFLGRAEKHDSITVGDIQFRPAVKGFNIKNIKDVPAVVRRAYGFKCLPMNGHIFYRGQKDQLVLIFKNGIIQNHGFVIREQIRGDLFVRKKGDRIIFIVIGGVFIHKTERIKSPVFLFFLCIIANAAPFLIGISGKVPVDDIHHIPLVLRLLFYGDSHLTGNLIQMLGALQIHGLPDNRKIENQDDCDNQRKCCYQKKLPIKFCFIIHQRF